MKSHLIFQKLSTRYVSHILQLLAPDFRYLLVTYKYDPASYPGKFLRHFNCPAFLFKFQKFLLQIKGPPHMVPMEELNDLYSKKLDSFFQIYIIFTNQFDWFKKIGSTCKIELIDSIPHRDFIPLSERDNDYLNKTGECSSTQELVHFITKL
jgi:hypothetical protein